VPGELKGYAEAHRRFGRLAWPSLLEPTIDLCTRGFPVGRQLAFSIKRAEADIRRNRGLAAVLIDRRTNKILAENDIIKCEALARTLRLVSQHGADVIYKGTLTSQLVAEVNANGGNWTVRDLNDYQVRVHENRYEMRLDDKYRMFAPPPPSSSILVGLILRVMSGFALTSEASMTRDERRLFYHRFVETVKHAYAVRQKLGDEAFVDVGEMADKMSKDDEFIRQMREEIRKRDRTKESAFYGQAWDRNNVGTGK
jgi:gamma-glutamyltranspeptidase/glutathione hydrolase/leukotriene-C4 hydrolase